MQKKNYAYFEFKNSKQLNSHIQEFMNFRQFCKNRGFSCFKNICGIFRLWFLTEFNGALRLSSYKYTAECNYCLEVYKRLAVKGESGLRVTKGRRIQQKKVEDNPLRFSR